jgi:hypothetical protein
VFLLSKSIKAQRAAQASHLWLFTVRQVADVSVKVDGDTDSGKYRYMPGVSYVYDVNGKICECDKINFGRGPIFISQQGADEFLLQYRSEADVNLYYDPNQPKNSVLRKELSGHKVNLITGVIMIIVMGQMLLALFFIMRL